MGHYRLLEQIGAGGMGVVYRARDERLERDVALKLLPAGTLGDESTRKRFRQEALALSQLNHPNIATVHDFDTQDGLDFLVLEHIEGETLDARLARGPFAERDVVKLGVQLAEGLEAAHRRGVVHRDIKPGNLRITSEGKLKILDFGLARLVRPLQEQGTLETLTDTQTIVGTLPYMAPEQLAGEKADARSDIYAAGAVLYELATGRRPFTQVGAAALMYAIMNQPPEPPSAIHHRISEGLDTLILKALEKNPELRYQSARELRVDLERAITSSSTRSARVGRGRKTWPTRSAGVLAALGVLTLGASLWVFDPGGWRDRLGGAGAGTVSSLAVLPLTNLSADSAQEYFADGMTDELITRLTQISALRVRPGASVVEYRATRKRPPQIGRELRVDILLTGSVMRSGDRVRISAQLVRAQDEENLWADSFEGELRNVLLLQREVAQAVAEIIRLRVTAAERARLAVATEVNPRAYEACLKGQYHMLQHTELGFRTAIQEFNDAISIDPVFARAYAGLANTYAQISSLHMPARDAMPRARAAALRAIAIDSTSAEAYSVLAYVKAFYDWNWAAAEGDFRKAIELQPGSEVAHLNYCYYLYTTRRFGEAMEEQRRAAEIDPLATNTRVVKGSILMYSRHYDEAIQLVKRVVEDDPKDHIARAILAQCYLAKRDSRAALREMQEANRLEDSPFTTSWLGCVYASSGNRKEALAMLARLKERADTSFVQPYDYATLYAALGDADQAFDWLRRGVEERSEEMCTILNDPKMDPLHSDARFATIVSQLGLTP